MTALPVGLTTVSVLIFPFLTLMEIGVLGEMSLEPKAGDAMITAADRGGATGLGVVGDGALGGVEEGVGAKVGVLPIVGSATLIGADGPAAVTGA